MFPFVFNNRSTSFTLLCRHCSSVTHAAMPSHTHTLLCRHIHIHCSAVTYTCTALPSLLCRHCSAVTALHIRTNQLLPVCLGQVP